MNAVNTPRLAYLYHGMAPIILATGLAAGFKPKVPAMAINIIR